MSYELSFKKYFSHFFFFAEEDYDSPKRYKLQSKDDDGISRYD
jgi:hypothetical protein